MLKIQAVHKEQLFAMMDEGLSGLREDIATHKQRELGIDKAKRFRWDLYHITRVRNARILDFVCDTLYAYMNDTHLDSVMKEYVKLREY